MGVVWCEGWWLGVWCGVKEGAVRCGLSDDAVPDK